MYITKERIIRNTGIKAEDFNITIQADFETMIDEWIEDATDIINEDRNRDYEKEVLDGKREKVPAGIKNIAERMVSNMVAKMILRRQTPITQNEDFEVTMTSDEVFTDSIKKDLARYPMKSTLNIFRVGAVDDEVIDDEL